MTDPIVAEYISGASLTSLAKKYRKAWSTIKALLISKGVALRTLEEAKAISRFRSIPMSNGLRQRIEGEMLGDGMIALGQNISPLSFSSKHQEYMEWLAELLVEENIPLSKRGVHHIMVFDKRTRKTYKRFYFRTLGTAEIHRIGTRWYRSGIKSIPQDLVLDRSVLLHWWLGDGCVVGRTGNKYGLFCTDSFSNEDVEYLSRCLNKLLDIDTKPQRRKNPNGNYVLRIYIPHVGLLKMLDFIGNSPIGPLAHRWRT